MTATKRDEEHCAVRSETQIRPSATIMTHRTYIHNVFVFFFLIPRQSLHACITKTFFNSSSWPSGGPF